jgi:hypothetical protein
MNANGYTTSAVTRDEYVLDEEMVLPITSKARNGEVDEKEEILRHLDIDVYSYLSQHLIPERASVKVLNAALKEELENRTFIGIRSIINLALINRSKFINKYLIKINELLPDAGIYIGCFEERKLPDSKIIKHLPRFLKRLIQLFTFLFHRVMPKIKLTRGIYYFLTQGKYRWLTKAEVLGRVVSCGFDIIEYEEIKGRVYFVVMKVGKPVVDKKPSYGPVFPMSRVGKGGKMIRVYKIRTMHPYSEYLQDFILKLHGYNEFGKPANDFRLTSWGKFMRKYWLDELPQLLNVLKGEMGLFGVRPVSLTHFKAYPDHIRDLRIQFKPGCIPPYVALCVTDVGGQMEAEWTYMQECLKRPFWTPIKYFFLGLYNILTAKIRSA